MTDAASIAALPRQLTGPVDVLVNNAGVAAAEEEFGAFDAATMARVLQINSIAPMLVTQALTPLLQKGGTAPKVVCITSGLGSITNADGLIYGLSYGMSKAALNMGVKKLAPELGRRGIAIVALHPGWVRTDMGGSAAPLRPPESIRGMLAVIDRLTVADTGRFLTYEGKELPW